MGRRVDRLLVPFVIDLKTLLEVGIGDMDPETMMPMDLVVVIERTGIEIAGTGKPGNEPQGVVVGAGNVREDPRNLVIELNVLVLVIGWERGRKDGKKIVFILFLH